MRSRTQVRCTAAPPRAWTTRADFELPAGERPFSLATIPGPPGAVVVQVSGPLDAVSAPLLAAVLARLEPREVVVDLRGVDLLCAAGLNALAGARRALARRGGRLRVTGARPLAARCMVLTGLQELLDPAS